MRLEDQVCTLEQGKKLHKLGIEAECSFLWVNGTELWMQPSTAKSWRKDGLSVPAYTVAELGEMLPGIIKDDDVNYFFGSSRLFEGDSWEACYAQLKPYQGCLHGPFEYPTEAQARAAMLIHLIENGIVATSKTTEA